MTVTIYDSRIVVGSTSTEPNPYFGHTPLTSATQQSGQRLIVFVGVYSWQDSIDSADE